MEKNTTKESTSLEKQLFRAADKLRKNIDAAEYKHIVLGLLFLRYISEGFTKRQEQIKTKPNRRPEDLEDRYEYMGENVFFVPPKARWSYLRSQARDPQIGKHLNDAMDLIEQENKSLKNVLPKDYTKSNLASKTLGELIDCLSSIDLHKTRAQSADVLGRTFEYFLGEFALQEGKKGGQFYTPKSIVDLLVKMLEPYEGRILDPCCGSGGIFVQSDQFVKAHQGDTANLSLYGQESSSTTWRLAKMNLGVRNIDSQYIKWNAEGSFLKNEHPDTKVDFVIANPPFNDSDWSGNELTKDVRWSYGVPPVNSANYAWIQHFIHHLKPQGRAGFVMSKGALTSSSSGEDKIRRAIIQDHLVDCIVNLPSKLFLNTQIPASLWFLDRAKATDPTHPRRDHILFIDAQNMGYLVNRRNRALSQTDIEHITQTYHHWREVPNKYNNEAGFCKVATLQEVADMDHVLTPGRYVGLPPEEEHFDVMERLDALTQELYAQLNEEAILNQCIRNNLTKLENNE